MKRKKKVREGPQKEKENACDLHGTMNKRTFKKRSYMIKKLEKTIHKVLDKIIEDIFFNKKIETFFVETFGEKIFRKQYQGNIFS